MSSAKRKASSASWTTPSKPGMVFTLAVFAIFLLSILSPIAFKAYLFGPMNTMPSFSWKTVSLFVEKNVTILNNNSSNNNKSNNNNNKIKETTKRASDPHHETTKLAEELM